MELFHRPLRVRRRVIFRKPRGCIGLCETEHGGRIFVSLNTRRVPLGSVYLHELLHALYPNWSEKQVLYMERHLWKRLSVHQKYLLYKKLFRHPYSTEEGV